VLKDQYRVLNAQPDLERIHDVTRQKKTPKTEILILSSITNIDPIIILPGLLLPVHLFSPVTPAMSILLVCVKNIGRSCIGTHFLVLWW
jgi:hypothetical protein